MGQTQLNIPTPLYTKGDRTFVVSCITTVLVALEFHYRSVRFNPHRIALFPGAFNPPTVAHVAIALAAHTWASEVVWTLPRAFPHKGYEGADLHARLEMLRRLATATFRLSIITGER